MSDETMKYRPRLCHLKKWSNFQGYGFNLHAEKSRNGQYIGKVDANSPAESAGLKERDRIIEVNYVNISNENHQQVVRRIRNGLDVNGHLNEDEVVLLVVDLETDEHFKSLGEIVRNDMESVLRIETKPENSLDSIENHNGTANNSTSQIDDNNNNSNDYNDHQVNNDTYYDRKSITSDTKSETKLTTSNNSLEQIQQKISATSIASNEHLSSQPQTPESTKSNKVLKTTTSASSSTAAVAASSSNNDVFNDLDSQRSLQIDEIKPVESSRENSVKKFQYSRVEDNNNDDDEDSLSNNISSEFRERAFKATRQMLEASLSLDTPERKKIANNTSSAPTSTPTYKNENERFLGNDSPKSSKEDSLNKFFKMSAQQFKEHLKQKTKADPRVNPVDMKQKHQIFQNM